jgi:DNA-binding transcriptional ArsR family regulator
VDSEEAKQRLLVAFLAHSQVHGFVDHHLSDVAKLARIEPPAGYADLVVDLLAEENFLKIEKVVRLWEGGSPPRRARLTSAGLIEAERLANIFPEFNSPIPASDRYVSLDDNQRLELREAVADLYSAVEKSNEGDEERENALAEIAVFEATIIQPRISTELVERFVSYALGSGAKVFAGIVVHDAAKFLLRKIAEIFGIGA